MFSSEEADGHDRLLLLGGHIVNIYKTGDINWLTGGEGLTISGS
jgi:hypothetical protein